MQGGRGRPPSFYLHQVAREEGGRPACNGEPLAPHAASGIVNRAGSGIFPVVNVAQVGMGLSEILVGCSAGTVEDRPHVVLLISGGKFNL